VWSETGTPIFIVPNIEYSYSRLASSFMVVPLSPVVCDRLRAGLGRGKLLWEAPGHRLEIASCRRSTDLTDF